MTFKSDLAIERIFSLFDKWGHENYIGESVTQLQHSQQVRGNNVYIFHIIFHKKAALQAEKAGYDDTTIIGAFLHDIGIGI